MAVETLDWKGNAINKRVHGGHRAAVFIYSSVAVLSVANVPNFLTIITYLRGVLHMGISSSSTTTSNFFGATCAFALVSGVISDSYLTRFRTMLLFGPFQLLGYLLLATQAYFHSPHSIKYRVLNFESLKKIDTVIVYVALFLIALGEGSFRSCIAPFGSDQFDNDDPVELRMRSTFFNWFATSRAAGGIIGLAFIVWIERNMGWVFGFTVSTGVVLLGIFAIVSGFTIYRNKQPNGSPFAQTFKVFVAAFQKRNLVLPNNDEKAQHQQVNDCNIECGEHQKSKGFRFLEKATLCDGNSRSLCTIIQVEEAKVILRVIPIVISAMLAYMPYPLLLMFTVQQGDTMDTKLGSLYISPVSLLLISFLFQMLILVAYDRLFVPLARRRTGYKNGITQLQRVGAGFVAVSAAAAVAAMIETKRKQISVERGLLQRRTGLPMSVLWLGFQVMVAGIVEASTFVGLLEFLHTEFSAGMKSMAAAIFWCTLGLGSFLGSLLVGLVNRISKQTTGKMGWLEGDNLNNNQLDLFYWLLFVVELVAFLNFLYWANRYVYRHNPRHATA